VLTAILTVPDKAVVIGTTGKAYVSVHAVVAEDDTNLSSRLVSAQLDWGDGLSPTLFGPEPESLTLASPRATRELPVGTFVVVLTATNFRAPVPDVIVRSGSVTVTSGALATRGTSGLVGPGLPTDGDIDWSFTLKHDTALLASDVRMLLLTRVGERVLAPTYGTKLWKVLFEPFDHSTIESMVVEDVTQTLSAWEQRVALLNTSVTWEDNRTASLHLVLLSRLNKQQFSLVITYEQ